MLSVIHTKNIDIEDRLYIFSFPVETSEPIKENIVKWNNNIYYKPILLEKLDNSTYRPIAEISTLLLLKRQGHIKVRSNIINGSPLSIFIRGIIETLNYRKLNLIEKANIVKILLNQFKEPLEEYMPLLGEQTKGKRIKDIQKLSELIEPIKEYIVGENLNLSIASKLSCLQKQEQIIINLIIGDLKLNANKLKLLLDHVFAIAKKSNGDKKELLLTITNLIKTKESAKSKEDMIFTVLFSKRYPLYKEQLGAIKNAISCFKLPPQWKILPKEESLEAEGIKLIFHIKNKEEYKKAIDKLTSIMETKDIDKLFSLL